MGTFFLGHPVDLILSDQESVQGLCLTKSGT